MPFEVELKFPLPNPQAVLAKLAERGAVAESAVRQSDAYFNHPSRDFAQTDEALRIRTVGDKNFVTYKGPLVDKQTKTRQEIELPLGDGAQTASELGEILCALGFRPVRAVNKSRTPYRLTWEGREFELSLDDVDGLGTFLEIEILADEAGLAAARESILRLAASLGLENSERKSYLCLLLERAGG